MGCFGNASGFFQIIKAESFILRHGRAKAPTGPRKARPDDRLRATSRRCPGHPRLPCGRAVKTWVPGTRPGMTRFAFWRHAGGADPLKGSGVLLLESVLDESEG